MVTDAVKDSRVKGIARIIAVLFLLYAFLVSISLMSHAFKGFGREFAEVLIRSTSDPFIGFFVGLLATSLIQSSSTTTSMVVAFVASGALTVRNAIPIIMGANIGTAVTATLVALGHVTRREEFKRALGCSTMHDFFNMLTAAILLPLEITTHYLERTASFFAEMFGEFSGIVVQSPLKAIIKPVVKAIEGLFIDILHLPAKAGNICMLVLAVIILFVSLVYLMKLMRSLIIAKTESILDNVFGKNAAFVIVMGMLFTAIVQSSSVTTSIMVPIVASGIVTMENAFPVLLGANLGTTITAILASLTGNVAAVTIAFAHLFFNLTGILIFYPVRAIRRIPMAMARKLGEVGHKKPFYAFAFILTVFFILPGLLIFISRALK